VVERLVRDRPELRAHGIQLLTFGQGPCREDNVFVEVVVADEKTVSFLTGSYGDLEITGWLQPI